MAIATVLHFFAAPNTPDNFFSPVVALSVFVLSAAVMGYLFVGETLQLYLNGEKKQAVSFFASTVLCFAVLTIVAVICLKLAS